MLSLNDEIGGCLTTRMLEGNVPVVGVDGSTLTEWCGIRVTRDTFVTSETLEEVEEALERE